MSAANEDWFVEPLSVSDALFRAEAFTGGIWDPACGQGNVLLAAQAQGHKDIVGSDNVQRGLVSSRLWEIQDFFACDRLIKPNIVTNPPSGSMWARVVTVEKFIRHAISLGPEKLAVFVDVRFLFG